MTAKTTVTIEAVHPDGTDLTNQRVVVQLIHGGAGGTVDGELIAERTTVPLTGAGPWSIALYPTAAISPSGCFYRFTIDNSSPTINRDISVPSSGPVSWTDAAILLENPDPPVTVPAAISGDPLDVLRVNAEGTGYELAPGLATALGVAPEPLLLHHSFRRAEDGEAAGMSNGQGLLGPKALTDISDFLPLVYQEAQVDAGALRLRAVSPHTLAMAFSDAILGTAPVGRGGFMIDEYGAATVAADCDGVVFTAAAVADGSGDGYAALLRLTGDGIGGIDAEVVIVAVASGVFGADLDAFTLPRMPVPGDTVEIRVDGTDSPATISGFWNGEEVVSVTDATTDPSTFTTASVSATTDSLADPTKWLPAVTDAWFTDGGAWWPGSLPGAGGGGTVDVVSNVATNTILGRTTAGTGNSEELSPASARTLLDVYATGTVDTALGLKAPLASPTFTGTVAGVTAAMVGAPSGSGTSSGTNTGDQTITLTGDVTGSGTGSFTTAIGSGVIVNADVSASAAIARSKLATPGTGLYVSGAIYHMPVQKGDNRNIAPGSLTFFPINLDGPCTIDALSIDVVTGAVSGTSHLYLVSASATTGRPTAASTILASTSSVIATNTSISRVTGVFGTPYVAAPGLYWGAIHSIVGTATYRGVSTSFQLGPPLSPAGSSSANGVSCIVATGGGTSTTPLADLTGITIGTDTISAPIISWRVA